MKPFAPVKPLTTTSVKHVKNTNVDRILAKTKEFAILLTLYLSLVIVTQPLISPGFCAKLLLAISAETLVKTAVYVSTTTGTRIVTARK